MHSASGSSSGDATSSSEVIRAQSPSQSAAASASPVQEIVERAYRVQNEGSLACFVAAALAMFLLLCLVAYFFFGHGGLLQFHDTSERSAKAAVLTRPRGSVPGPVMSCYYDPAWSNATERGAWAYDLTQHFHTDTCTHAVFVGVEYGYRGIMLPEYVSDSLANFLTLKRPGLPLLVSVMVQDVAGAASNPEQFAVIVVDWAIRNSFDGVELDMPEGTAARGYDALAQALSTQMALATQLWILSANVYTTTSFVNQVDLQQLHRAVDFLVLNTQNLARNDQVISAHSPLYGNNSWNSTLGMVYASANTLSRLVPVVPFMSREFELRDALPHATVVAAGIRCRGLAAKTQYHSSPGVRAFFEVCQTLNDTSWLRAWQEDDYCFMTSKERRFIVLETRESINCKMLFIAAHRLLGVALKQLGLDTIRASQECGSKDTLFNVVANEFRQLQRSGDGKLPWKSRHVRLTVVRESGRTACVGAV